MLEVLEDSIPPESDGYEDPPPEECADFGFHYPLSTVELVAWVLKASNFSYWPEPGGLLNQDAYLIDDVRQFFRLQARVEWEVKHLGGVQYPDEYIPAAGSGEQVVRMKMNG